MDQAVVPGRIFDAAVQGRPQEVVKWLASHAAPRDAVQKVTIHGDATLLSFATFGRPFDARHVKLVRLLISLGANVNQIETDGASPLINVLHFFGINCSGKAVIDMISLLLSAGADVNLEGGRYGFPISMVVQKLDQPRRPGTAVLAEVVTMLLRAGASVDSSSASNVSGWEAMRNVRSVVGQSGNDTTPGEPLYADPHFIALKAQIDGVHAAGSWRAYIMAPRLEVLTLRGLANRGKIRSTDPALNNLVALPNELICQVLAFWFG